MAESRANRIKENGIWRYLDQNDAELVLMSSFDYPIEAVDDFIDGLHGVALPEETISLLRGMRHDALQAYIGKNIPLMEAHLRGLNMACRAAGMIDAARKGVKFSKTQTARAKNKRSPKTESGESVHQVIERLSRTQPTEHAKELWPSFFGELDRLGMSPSLDETSTVMAKWRITYMTDESQKPITFGRFANLVSQIRNHVSPAAISA